MENSELTPMELELQEVANHVPNENKFYEFGYEQGKLSGRAEAITTVINLLKENPNIDGLEILKKL